MGKSSRVSTFWAKFSPIEEWTARPRALLAVAGSGTLRPYLNHQRIWQSTKQRTWLGEALRMNCIGIRKRQARIASLTKLTTDASRANIMLVNVISKRGLFEQAAKYPDARPALQVWFDTARAAKWTGLEDLRKTFPATDMVGDLAIFNIRGNQYRLIVRMVWRYERIYIKEFLTHAEYDKGRWKKWLV